MTLFQRWHKILTKKCEAWICDACDTGFKSYRALKKHQKKHEAEHDESYDDKKGKRK